MDKRLIKLIRSRKIKGIVILDTYNQQVFVDIAPTIRARINNNNAIWVAINEEEEDKT